ncbi:MAG: hypothetical protein ACR2N7_05445 [Acidimicrobiia bacterium]
MPTKPANAFSKPIAVGLWLLAVALLMVGVVVGSAGDGSLGEASGIMLIVLAFATTGLVLALRVPRNRMGWLYLSSGVLGGIYVSSFLYAQTAVLHDDSTVTYAAVVSSAVYFPWVLSMISLPVLLFPDGYPPSRGLFWLQWVIGGLAIVTFLGRVLSLDPVPGLESHTSPLGFAPIDRILNSWLFVAILIAALLVSLLGPPAALVYRYKRAEGLERQQLKWLAYAAAVAAAGLALTYTVGELTDSALVSVATAIGLLGVLGIPVATGIAISRYRLYDLDRIISRTVSYGIVVFASSGLFVAVVALVSIAVPTRSGIATAAATLAAAALFNPLRRRVQRSVDRRFNRNAYQAQGVAERFSTQMQQVHDVDQVAEIWVAAVTETLQPSSIAYWMYQPETTGTHQGSA